MASKDLRLKVGLFLMLLGVVAAAPAFAGSAVIGSVAGSMNATIGGQALMPNTTVFSGDSLQVNDGVAVVAIDKSSRVVFGRETTASFLRDTNEVTVLLSRGNLSMYHPQDSVGLRVKVGEVTVVPAKGFKTLGEVAMVGNSVVISAKEGSFRVEGSGSALEVAKGKTITIAAKTARSAAPAPGRPQLGGVSTNTALEAGALGAGAAAAILAGIAMSRAGDAKDAANSAITAANAATAAGNAATAAANAADTDASHAGCVLNTIAVGAGFASVSPFTPTSSSNAGPGC